MTRIRRVEGTGAATIHYVAETSTDILPKDSQSPNIKAIDAEASKLSRAKQRVNLRLQVLASYMSKIGTEHTSPNVLGSLLNTYEAEVSKLHDRLDDVNERLQKLKQRRAIEDQEYPVTATNRVQGVRVGMEVHEATDIGLKVTYGAFLKQSPHFPTTNEEYSVVPSAWYPLYDLRVDLTRTATPVELVYKAVIPQNSSEAWDDAVITLNSAMTTFDTEAPVLDPWWVAVWS